MRAHKFLGDFSHHYSVGTEHHHHARCLLVAAHCTLLSLPANNFVRWERAGKGKGAARGMIGPFASVRQLELDWPGELWVGAGVVFARRAEHFSVVGSMLAGGRGPFMGD